MARPSNKDKEITSDIEKLRKETIKRFFGLTEKVYAHIQDSMKATRQCVSCTRNGNEHIPGKAVDENGKCALCHGTYLVPDLDQRNWATERAQPIIAPAPKTVEMSVDQTSRVPELEDKVKQMPTGDIDKKLEVLGFLDDDKQAEQS